MANPSPPGSTLAAFNAASPQAAERDVLACCASGSFAKLIAEGLPRTEHARARPDQCADEPVCIAWLAAPDHAGEYQVPRG